MEKKQILGLIGVIVLFIGVFLPIVSVPIVGSITYFQNGEGDGVFIIILAVISLILIFSKKYKGLWFTGLASLCVLAFTFFNFQIRMSNAKANLQQELADNPFAELGELALQSIQLQLGWAVLIVGAALIIAAAVIKE